MKTIADQLQDNLCMQALNDCFVYSETIHFYNELHSSGYYWAKPLSGQWRMCGVQSTTKLRILITFIYGRQTRINLNAKGFAKKMLCAHLVITTKPLSCQNVWMVE